MLGKVLYTQTNYTVWIEFELYVSTYATALSVVTLNTESFRVDMVVFDQL